MNQETDINMTSRRHDRLGVHSVGEFHMTVPSLAEAEKFYGVFGLKVSREGDDLTLRTMNSDHVWGRLSEGPRKKFDQMTFHCFEDETDKLYAHILAQGVEQVAPPNAANDAGIWFRDPDRLVIQVRPGPKTSTNVSAFQHPPLPLDGKRNAAVRGEVRAALPQRLSHILRQTPSIPTQIDFYTRVLGLRLSDRTGDRNCFLHGPHGSDHHLVGFARSTAAGLHHLCWDVPTFEDVGLGMERMLAAGYGTGFGVGRHVQGSNYYYYAQDPWGSWCEFSAAIDYIPAAAEWDAHDHTEADAMSLWGPPIDPIAAKFFANSES